MTIEEARVLYNRQTEFTIQERGHWFLDSPTRVYIYQIKEVSANDFEIILKITARRSYTKLISYLWTAFQNKIKQGIIKTGE